MVSLHRLHTVAKLTAEVADPRNVVSEALERFSGLTAGLRFGGRARPGDDYRKRPERLRALQNLAIRGGLGLASGPDGWWISYRDRMFETKDLLAAAEELHRAIRAAVDPEAFSDFRGDHPLIELRDPADIARPWRPGSDITDRQAATMARIQPASTAALAAPSRCNMTRQTAGAIVTSARTAACRLCSYQARVQVHGAQRAERPVPTRLSARCARFAARCGRVAMPADRTPCRLSSASR